MPKGTRPQRRAAPSAPPVEKSTSLLATEAEKLATSHSLYTDRKARIAYNLGALHDPLRMPLYRGALAAVLRGKHVLHLGCGMGLAAMMLARDSAASVVAVDHSAIVDAAKVVAAQNSMGNVFLHAGTVYDLFALDTTGQVTVAHDALKSFLDGLPNASASFRFDAVVCEWSGPLLLSEPVALAQTLFARDHLLRSPAAASGSAPPFVFPQRSSLYVVGITDYRYRSDTVDFWDSVYGFDMSPMKPLVLEDASASSIPHSSIVTEGCFVASLNMAVVPAGDVQGSCPERVVEGDVTLVASRRSTIHFLTFYIDALFHHPTEEGCNVVMGYQPGGGAKANAWTEVSVMLHTPIPVFPGDRVASHIRVMQAAQPMDAERVPPTRVAVDIKGIERAGRSVPMVDDSSLLSSSTHLYFP